MPLTQAQMRALLVHLRDQAVAGIAQCDDGASSMPSYLKLRHDDAVIAMRSIRPPSRNGYITDPDYNALGEPPRHYRVTDDGGWGTNSAANACGVSADDSQILACHQSGKFRVYAVDLRQALPFTLVREDAFSVEPTFSRLRPNTLFAAQHGTFEIFEAAVDGGRKVLFNVQDDVGPLSQAKGQYMGACYSSQSTPEILATAYGRTQELHPYVTILNVADSRQRITLNVTISKIKVQGGPWGPLLNADDSPANLTYGIHAVDLDRSGRWVRITVRGNAQHVFFHVPSMRIYQWPQNADQYTWFGHHAWGWQTIVRAICGPGDPGEYQWLFSDFRDPQTMRAFRKLVEKTNVNDQNYDDHPNTNHWVEGQLRPVLCGVQRGYGQVKAWDRWDDELLMVNTDPAAPAVYRIGKHRCGMVTGDFYESPRPQAFHSGRAALYSSHWNKGLSHGGTDLFCATF